MGVGFQWEGGWGVVFRFSFLGARLRPGLSERIIAGAGNEKLFCFERFSAVLLGGNEAREAQEEKGRGQKSRGQGSVPSCVVEDRAFPPFARKKRRMGHPGFVLVNRYFAAGGGVGAGR